MFYDDFSRPNSGWAPLYLDKWYNFNGYSAGRYLFASSQTNLFLYDVQPHSSAGMGRYAVEITFEQGTGESGLLLGIQGDPNLYQTMSYISVGLTHQGGVVVRNHPRNSNSSNSLMRLPPGSIDINPGVSLYLGIDLTFEGLRVLVDEEELLVVPDVQVQPGAIGMYIEAGEQPLRVAFDNLLALAATPLASTACADMRVLFNTALQALATGNDVQILQRRLAFLGYDLDSQADTFDHATESAVREFQRHNNLPTDGIVDQQTWCRLLSSTALVATHIQTEGEMRQQQHHPIELNPVALPSTPMLLSIRQADQSGRIALVLPNNPTIIYLETGSDAMDAALAPDGSALAFTSLRSGQSVIWMLDTHTGEVQQISPSKINSEFPAWSPDSQMLIYIAEPMAGQIFAARAYIFDRSSGETTLLEDEHTGWIDWSAKNELVFTRWTGKSFDLFRSNPDGSNLTNLTNTNDSDEDIAAWSPDGNQIAFVRNPRGVLEERQIVVMQHDGSNLRQITAVAPPNSNPIWLIDGLVFVNQPTEDIWQPWVLRSNSPIPLRLSTDTNHIQFLHTLPPRTSIGGAQGFLAYRPPP